MNKTYVMLISLCSVFAATLMRPAMALQPFCGVYVEPSPFGDPTASAQERETRMDDALDKMLRCGFTTLIPYANTSSGKAWWPGKTLTQAGAQDFDTLGVLCRKARDRGMKVMPAVCVLVSGDDKPAGILESHPDWAVRSPTGDPLGYISPSSPEARAWVVAMISEMAAHVKPDGVMLDYVRFPNIAGATLPASPELDPQRLQQAKEGSLSLFMAEISAALRAQQPSIKIGLYTWGPHVAVNYPVAQRWPDWVRDGYLDLINVSGYCYTDNDGEKYMQVFEDRLRGATELAKKAGGKAEMSFALGVLTSHGAIKSAAQINDYISVARKAGCPGVAAYAWKSVEPYADEIQRKRYFK